MGEGRKVLPFLIFDVMKKKEVEVTITIGDKVYKLVDFDEDICCDDCDIMGDFKVKNCEVCYALNLLDRNAIFQRQ